MSARGLIVGAPRSGSGKTSVTIGLIRALRRRGVKVRAGKSGPDYVDPGFHAAATGHPGVNLDSWAMAPDLLDRLIRDQAADADILVIETAMGLFDGIAAEPGRSGAGADLARRYALPVVLILDISGQSQTAAAIAKGFATYDPDLRVAAVILNQVASPRHDQFVRKAIEQLGLPVVGSVPRNSKMGLPERHLGLVQASEHAGLEEFIEGLANIMETSLDLDAILDLASPVAPLAGSSAHALPPPGQRIAIAQDDAFSFVYPHLAQQWRDAGAELVPFSPLADQGPARSCDVCWLPGGYPELHAGALAAAGNFATSLRHFAEMRAVHGECGGHMVLGRAIEDAKGFPYPMVGLLDHVTSFAQRKLHLGYRQARLLEVCALGAPGDMIRGHEFHYSRTIEAGQDTPLAELFDGQGKSLGPAGAKRGRVTGTFFHAIARG